MATLEEMTNEIEDKANSVWRLPGDEPVQEVPKRRKTRKELKQEIDELSSQLGYAHMTIQTKSFSIAELTRQRDTAQEELQEAEEFIKSLGNAQWFTFTAARLAKSIKKTSDAFDAIGQYFTGQTPLDKPAPGQEAQEPGFGPPISEYHSPVPVPFREWATKAVFLFCKKAAWVGGNDER